MKAAVRMAAGIAWVATAAGFVHANESGTTVAWEHYAFSWQAGYLDGPRREAMGKGLSGLDEAFNAYVGGRVIRASDDMMATYMGDDYSTLDFGGDEGPAAFLPRLSPIGGTGYGQGIGGLVIIGRPLEGGDQGRVYAYSDQGIWRIWRNPGKGGRWWFKRLAGAGALAAPGGKIHMGQAWRKTGGKEHQAVFFTTAGFYILEDRPEGATFTEMLNFQGLADQLPKSQKNKGKTARPTLGAVDGDGVFYLGFYFSAPDVIKIMTVSADKGKVEPLATDGGRSGRDGPGMQSGWFCGPHFHQPKAISPWGPPGVLLCHTHDEGTIRRVTVKDRRVATLCLDGEWREKPGGGDGSSGPWKIFNSVSAVLYGANGWTIMAKGHPDKMLWGQGLLLVKGLDLGKSSASLLDEK